MGGRGCVCLFVCLSVFWRGESLFGLCFHITVYHEKESGQELEEGKNPEQELV